jgi:Tol biopolymer transport system component
MKRPLSHSWLLVPFLVPLALLVSACLPAGVRVPQNPLSGVLERKSGLIAYLATDGNIYTVDQGGQRKTQITKDAFADNSKYMFYGLPAWAPDGQSLAFVSYTGLSGQNPTSMSLFTAHKDGTKLVEAHKSADPLVYYYWSPNSRKLGFISATPNSNLAFQVISPDGSNSQLVDAGSPYYWTWAPDSRTVLAHSGSRLSLLQVDQNVVEQTLEIQPADFKAPAFSPNGQQVLVAGQTASGKTALMLADATGQNPRNLVEYSGAIAFVWSPNGQRVAYLVTDGLSAGATGHLVVADPTGKSKPVELKGSDVMAFFWSPDSKSLAYFTQDLAAASTTPVATATVDPSSPATATGTQGGLLLKLSVFDAGSGQSHSVASFTPSERFLQVIPYFDQYDQSLTIWSPDSRNLVVSAYRGDGTPAIWVVEASGHLDPRFIATGWMGFWSWH